MDRLQYLSEINPFNITKAVDYTDDDINKFWVDLNEGKGFIDFLKPSSPMPLMLLGSKGSGKTHIMRYFSFNLQKIRHKDNFRNKILEDKYLGIFLRCEGLNANKFEGSFVGSQGWRVLYSYYIELWFSQLLLKNVIECLSLCFEDYSQYEEGLIKDIMNLFDKDIILDDFSLNSILDFLNKQHKALDYEINNSSILGETPTVEILASPGKLIFGIPKLLIENIKMFEGFKFIFLIDEYENLKEYQQQYINTILRERKDPVTFRVGSRWYGLKTLKTFSGDESLLEGSEIETRIIDKWLREDDKKYASFSIDMIKLRLDKSGLIDVNSKHSNIESWFENFSIENFLKELQEKFKSKEKPYIKSLKEKLSRELKCEKEVSEIISYLEFNNNALIERTNIFLFYRLWKKSGANIKNAILVKSECENFTVNGEGEIKKILDKFKNDIIDQLHRETRQILPYYGLSKLIKMSSGNPRHLLIMLKHIYRWSIFNDEKPFSGAVISSSSQQKGVLDAKNWFFENEKGNGSRGRIMIDVINKIGQLLQVARFSDTPPECSLSTFSIRSSFVNPEIRAVLDNLERSSYVIKNEGSREKNSDLKTLDFQIAGMLAPQWELALYRRGRLQIEEDEVQAIFSKGNLDILLKNRELRYNAPFDSSNYNGKTLFD